MYLDMQTIVSFVVICSIFVTQMELALRRQEMYTYIYLRHNFALDSDFARWLPKLCHFMFTSDTFTAHLEVADRTSQGKTQIQLLHPASHVSVTAHLLMSVLKIYSRYQCKRLYISTMSSLAGIGHIQLLKTSNSGSHNTRSLAGVAMGYRLDCRGSIPGRGKRSFSTPYLPNRLWGSPVSCPRSTGVSFVVCKAAGACS